MMKCLLLLVNLVLLLTCMGTQALHPDWSHPYESVHHVSSFASRSKDQTSHANSRLKRQANDIPLSEVQRQFSEAISMQRMENQSLVIHTRIQGQDTLTFVNSTNGIEERCEFEVQSFHNFMVLGHLPVTALSILLPDLSPSDFTLAGNVSAGTYAMLGTFLGSLQTLVDNVDQWFSEPQQKKTGSSLIKKVQAFVKKARDSPASISRDSIESFTSDLQDELQTAAEFAVRSYFENLTMIYKTLQWNSSANVVIAAEGFSYPGSFLFQYYESEYENGGLTSERSSTIVAILNTTDFEPLRSEVSKAIYLQTINMLFQNTGAFPLHSVLTEAARVVLGNNTLNFRGFHSQLERLYIVLLVVLFSTTTIFCLVTFSVYIEDKRMKMENKPMEPKRMKSLKGPSLLTPIAEKEFASSYSAFHQLRKKHLRGKRRDSEEAELLSSEQEASKQEAGKRASLLSESDVPSLDYSGSTVNGTGPETRHAGIKLGDLSEA